MEKRVAKKMENFSEGEEVEITTPPTRTQMTPFSYYCVIKPFSILDVKGGTQICIREKICSTIKHFAGIILTTVTAKNTKETEHHGILLQKRLQFP